MSTRKRFRGWSRAGGGLICRRDEPEIEKMKEYLETHVRISLDNLQGELEHLQDMFEVKLNMMNEYIDKYVK